MKKVFIAILSVVLMGSAAFAATTTLALYRCGEGYSPPAAVGSGAVALADSSGNGLNYGTFMGSTWGGGDVVYSADIPSLLAGYSARSYDITHNGCWDDPVDPRKDCPDDNVGIEGWIKTSGASGAQVWGTIMFNLGGSFATYRVNGKYYALVGSKEIGHTPVPEWQWVHLALVRQGGTSTFFFNGKPVGTSTANPGNLHPSHQFEKDSGWTVWTGLTDEIRVFSFADPNAFDPLLDNQFNSAALSAWDAMPAPDATGILSTAVLSWKTGRDPNNPSLASPLITGHGIYIGTDRAAVEAATPADATGIFKGYQSVDQTTFTPTLENNKTYYWRVDERLDNDTRYVKGWIWTFGTVIDFPVITGQPQDTYAKVGDTAAFTVEAFDSQGKPLDYQWYKVGTPNEQLSDNSKYSGTATKQLKVLNVAVADEGRFYCMVTNSFGTTQSNSAILVAARMLGYWPFENTLDDSIGTNNGTGGPGIYEPGVIPDSNSVRLNKTTPVKIPLSPDIRSWTLSFWEYLVDPANTGYIVACGPSSGFEDLYLRRYPAGDAIGYAGVLGYAHGTSNGYPIMGPYPTGTWNYIAITCDAVAHISNVYVNGQLAGSDNTIVFNGFADQLFVGDRKSGGRALDARIDELKLYNYVQSTLDVATDYATITGEKFCAQIPTVDLNEDCAVNILDLVTMAANWMDCGLFPASACQ